MKNSLTLAVLLSLVAPAQAQHHQASPAAGAWIDEPMIQISPDRQDRNKSRVSVINLQAGQLTVYPPQGGPVTLALLPEGALLGAGPVGNYHWLQAREESPDQVRVASSIRYFAKPGPAPKTLLSTPKSELEIVPQPLPREHWQYRSNQEWEFLVRFQGQPLAGTALHFMTRQGSHEATVTGPEGIATLTFPDDWPVTGAGTGGHGRPTAPFVLMVEHQAAGINYHTTFNAMYSPSPMDGRNLALGSGFLALGGLLATPLLRRPKTSKEKTPC